MLLSLLRRNGASSFSTRLPSHGAGPRRTLPPPYPRTTRATQATQATRAKRSLGWLLLAVLVPSCGSLRAGVRDLRNADLEGQVAPPLSAQEPSSWVGEEPWLEGDWYLVAFLKPS